MKCLTPDWPAQDQLWQHPLYGARTLSNIEEMRQLRLAPTAPLPKLVEESEAMAIRRERHIDRYGCSY